MCDCPAHRELVDCTCSCNHSGDRIQQWRRRALQAEAARFEQTWDWLRTTHHLQRDHFNVPLREDGSGLEDPTQLADYVTWNATALSVELGEALNEIGWKPWSEPRGWVNRDKYVGELIDVGHFLANLLVAVGVTDEEWAYRYQQKQQINRDRQAGEYDTRKAKCPGCGRSYDDTGVVCTPEDSINLPRCEDYGVLEVQTK